MNQSQSTNSVFISNRKTRKENINPNEIIRMKEEYKLNQRKNKMYVSLMDKRMASLPINFNQSCSNTHVLAHYDYSNDKLEYIYNFINNEEIVKIENGLGLLKSLLSTKFIFNDHSSQLFTQIVQRLIGLLLHKKFHSEERKHYLFQCNILNILINLSCDYESVMNQLIIIQLFEYYDSELETNNLLQNTALIKGFLLLFSNMLIEEYSHLKVRQLVDMQAIIMNSFKLLSTSNFQSLHKTERDGITLNLLTMIYNWFKFIDCNTINQYKSVIVLVMNLFIKELSSNMSIEKAELINELLGVLLLLSNFDDCIPLFFTSTIASKLVSIVTNEQIIPNPYSITSFKIISNLLCVKSFESMELLQNGLFHFIYKRLISVNDFITHDELKDFLVLYSCQSISNMILTEETSALNYLLDINIIQALKVIILKYMFQCQIEALYVLFYASLVQNVKVNSILYKENIHLFLIAELKHNTTKEKEYIVVALNVIEQMLIYGETINKRMNYIKTECEDNGFDALIDIFQYDKDESISKKAKYLLETYWVIDDIFRTQNYFDGFVNR